MGDSWEEWTHNYCTKGGMGLMQPRIYRKPRVSVVWTYILLLLMVGIPTLFGKSLKEVTPISGLGEKHPQWIQVNPQKDMENLKRFLTHPG